MSIRALFCMLMVVLAGTHTVTAQPPPPPGEQSQFVFLTAVTHPDSDPGRARVDVHYRIDRGFFVAIRTSDTAATTPFTRSGEVLIELRDSLSRSNTRKIDRISVPDTRAESDPARRTWCEGIASFSVPPGPYTIFFEATDLHSDRRYVHRDPIMIRAITAPPSGSLQLFPIATITPVSDLRTEKIVPDNFGDDMLYNVPRQLLAAVLLPSDSLASVAVDYTITVMEGGEGRPGPVVAADSVSVLPVIRGYELRALDDSGVTAYTLEPRADSRMGFIAVPLRTAALPLRTYLLTLHARAGGQSADVRRPFRNVWPEMPRSLKNVDEALLALRFYVRETAIDSMMSGDFEQRRNALEKFWAAHDPTPGTMYNEGMTEYYRRVDHARTAFATLQEQDGTKTDRAKVYILRGEPNRIQRTLNIAGTNTETWIYDKGGRYVFEDDRRNGTYKLVSQTR